MLAVRHLLLSIIIAMSIFSQDHKISSVETSGSWIYFYDANGRRYKTLSASTVGEIKGYSSDIVVTKSGSWIYVYDSEGKRITTLSASSVRDVMGVAGETFTARNGSWIYTFDKKGKKINTRTAR